MAPKVSIIFGEPKKKDAFGGKGHELSARALDDGIRQIADKLPADKDGRPYQDLGGAIGLEGAWGSGKSTVIDIAREDYLKDDFLVFTFDLWRHQSDDFRRSLLEEFLVFVEDMVRDGKLADGVLETEKHRDIVRNRKTVTTKTDRRSYTLLGIAFILSLPLLPLIYTWLSPIGPFYKLMVGWGRWDKIYWVLTAGTIALAAFAASAFVASLKVTDKKKYSSPKWFTAGASRLFNITRQEEVNDEIKTIRDEDPTTVEFRTVFKNMLEPVQKAGHRVVFVLDNIDRLPAEDVRRVWADLRALNSKGSTDKNASVIAVIPYDRDHVTQAFPPLKPPASSKRPPIYIVSSEAEAAKVAREYVQTDKDSVEDHPVGSDVFEKTFDRIVKVSAPVTSDWKAYLLECVQDAFGKDHGHDTEKLFRLLKYRLELEGAQATPRRIISYVNDIGGLWVEWHKSAIPLPTVALYVLHRGDFDRRPEQLSHADPVRIRFQRIVEDKEYARNLAALAFNVDPAKANQLRLGQPIARALTDARGPGDLQSLAEADGFSEFFPDELRRRLDEWAVDSPEDISQAALNVAAAEPPLKHQAMIWGIFGDIIGQIQGLTYDLVDDVPGLFTIVGKQPAAGLAAVALRARFESVNKTVEPNPELLRRGSHWISLMRQLYDAVGTTEGGAAASRLWSSKPPSIDPEFIIGAANAAHQGLLDEFDQLDLGDDMKGLSNALDNQAGKDPSRYGIAMEVLHKRIAQFAPSQLARVSSLVQAGDVGDGKLQLIKVPQLFLPDHTNEVISALEPAATGGHLAGLASQSETTGHWNFSASALFLSVLASQAAALSETRGTEQLEVRQWYNSVLKDASGLHEQTVALLAEQVAKCGVVSIWVAHALDRGRPKGLVHVVLKRLLDVPAFNIENVAIIADRYTDLETILGPDGVSKLWNQVRLREVQSQYSSASLVVPPEMVHMLSSVKGEAAEAVLSLAGTRLEELDADTWHDALKNPSNSDLVLLAAMKEFREFQLKTPAFISGLVKMCIDVIEETFDPASISDLWPKVQKALPSSQYTPLRAQVVAGMRAANISSSGAVGFVRHLDVIAQKMRFSGDESTADMALTRFLWHLANSDDEAATRYLQASDSEIQLTLKAASSDEVRNAYLGVSRPEQGKD